MSTQIECNTGIVIINDNELQFEYRPQPWYKSNFITTVMGLCIGGGLLKSAQEKDDKVLKVMSIALLVGYIIIGILEVIEVLKRRKSLIIDTIPISEIRSIKIQKARFNKMTVRIYFSKYGFRFFSCKKNDLEESTFREFLTNHQINFTEVN